MDLQNAATLSRRTFPVSARPGGWQNGSFQEAATIRTKQASSAWERMKKDNPKLEILERDAASLNP